MPLRRRRDKLGPMKPEAIFAPVGVLALWTLFILFLVAFRRIEAARAGRVPRGAFRLGESPDVPPDNSFFWLLLARNPTLKVCAP